MKEQLCKRIAKVVAGYIGAILALGGVLSCFPAPVDALLRIFPKASSIVTGVLLGIFGIAIAVIIIFSSGSSFIVLIRKFLKKKNPEEKRYWANIRWTRGWWRQWFSEEEINNAFFIPSLLKHLANLFSPNIWWVGTWLFVAMSIEWEFHQPFGWGFLVWIYLIGQAGYNIGVNAERARQVNIRSKS